MDSQTRHALKQDKFVQTTQTGVSWVSENRAAVIRYSIAVVVVLGLVFAGAIYYNQQAMAGEAAFGAALDIYSSQLAQPGQPPTKGVYSSAADRAKAANAQFVQVAGKYGWLSVGNKAHYFAGLSYQDMGQNAQAESELKKASEAWDGNLSSLGKFALAGFYHQTGKDAQAIDLYNALIAKPSTAVPAYTSQLALADLYQAAGKTEQAKQIWAKVKDADKTGSAGSIAAEKLAKK
ncbi:MAG TPA: coatomer subunit epsilon [Acidobacteriaceae bacterium]|nr:coatomer subunit epsilon [Acidobacteriaceae bacterium]